ncbi:MAG: PDC sensor domain-containing protein [Acidobacteriaceae bacterium]
MKQPKEPLQESIVQQRAMLTDFLHKPLRQLAETCGRVWGNRTKMDAVLSEAFPTVPYCKFLYALNTGAVQISSNISRDGLIGEHFGRDRSDRPYMCEAVPSTGFLLSEAYISLRAQRPSLTAIQIVHNADGIVLGFVGADFALRDFPQMHQLYEEPRHWRQIKGDPSIRGTVFHQTRSESMVDRHLDTVLSVVEELMLNHGVYHVILHFSSSQAIIWVMDDPYRYRLLDMDALIDPDSCMAYPNRPYPVDSLVPAKRIRAVLDNLRALRFMDEMFYLRSGTLNIFNGIVGLTFSCDGSHYIPYDEFLKMDQAFWASG